jgi:hypothetical protein
MNIPPTKAGNFQSVDTNCRLHNTTQDLPLLEGIAPVVVQANKSNQTNFRTKTPRPKFKCYCLKHLMTLILNFKGGYEVRGIGRRLRGGMM